MWLQKLIDKKLLIEVPNFHLFLHASAKLQPAVPVAPHWFSRPIFAADGARLSELYKLNVFDMRDALSSPKVFVPWCPIDDGPDSTY